MNRAILDYLWNHRTQQIEPSWQEYRRFHLAHAPKNSAGLEQIDIPVAENWYKTF